MGEHFVVYNEPALCLAVESYTDCTARLNPDKPGVRVEDNRPAVPGYKIEKKAEQDESTAILLKHLGVDTSKVGVELTLGGDLTCVSGVGASASSCVAIARAVGEAQGRKMSEEDVNQAAYEGEKGYHGTPSGIDNTAATYGGVIHFERNPTGNIFRQIEMREPVEIVFASTGITSSTSKVVGDVRAKKDAEPQWCARLATRYQDVFRDANASLVAGDWIALGKAMAENHIICQELTVSCAELDALVEVANAAGAVGAKMSGTGRGGLMLALTPGVELQDQVAKALEASGKTPQVWKTRIVPSTLKMMAPNL